jgi:hypothetical protein
MAQTSEICLKDYQERQKQQNRAEFGSNPLTAPEFGVAFNHSRGIIR